MATTGSKPAFRWSEKYSVNIASLDRQHQGLFDTINELKEALASGNGREALEGVLQRLVQYAATHFAAEEMLMEEYGFPGLATHRVEHQSFQRKVAKYVEDFRAGKTGTLVSLMMFLQGWLKEHILRTDKAYGEFLNERGVR